MKFKILTTFMTYLILTGCSTTQEKIIETEYVDYNRDVVIKDFKEISLAIKEAMMIMARNDNALTSEVITPEKIRIANANATYIPSGMERVVPFNWKGPAMKALEALAKYSDYKFVKGGKKPVTMLEPVVFIDEENKNVADLIRFIESQTKDRISISIREFEDNKILEVNYVR
jgi:hypothetical protein